MCPAVAQAGAWRTKRRIFTTNYEPKSPVRHASDRSDEKTVIVRGALKEFSRLEIAEQETVGDVLKSLESAGPVSGMIKPPAEAELEQHLDQAGRKVLQKMRAQQAGAAFDHDYLAAQTDGHQKLLRTQEDYLRAGRELDAVNVAKLAAA